jgi:hypothetical protein
MKLFLFLMCGAAAGGFAGFLGYGISDTAYWAIIIPILILSNIVLDAIFE